jgi:uncharacterized protein
LVRIVVTGSSGLIGTPLVACLRDQGHEVVRLIRRAATARDEIAWNPTTGRMGPLGAVDAAVNLAGVGIGDHRWTSSYKTQIRQSRLDATRLLAESLAAMEPLPKVLVSASAVGYYGDRGDEVLDESSGRGDGFLAGVVEDWEAATKPASDAGIRVITTRSGLVMAREGGALARMLPLFRLGVGGKLGNGQQYWSFISLDDEVRAIAYCLETESLAGPVNLTAPHPVTNEVVTRTLAHAMHRPSMATVPGFAMRIGLGELASDVLGGQRVIPKRLLASDFEFHHPDIASVIATVI